MFRVFCLACLATGLLSVSAEAASLKFDIRTSAHNGDGDLDRIDEVQEFAPLGDGFTRSVSTQDGETTADTEISIDAGTGAFTWENAANAELNQESLFSEGALSTFDLTIAERFRIQGNGQFGARFSLDGALTESGSQTNSDYAYLIAELSIKNRGSDRLFETTLSGVNNAVDDAIEVLFDIDATFGDVMDVTLRVLSYATASTGDPGGGEGEKDRFSNASFNGIFSVLTPEGGTAWADSGFLSNPIVPDDTPAVVPLPAGLPLLLAGLGAFGFMRSRRRV